MRRFLAFIVAAMATTFAATAFEPAIRDIDILVSLTRDGSAEITERWDVCVADGTEWYLVRYNLGDIKIEDFSVSDETGLQYENTEKWDVDWSLKQKTGKCGIVHTGKGDELCWGVGSYGDHVFTVRYKMTNAVKSLEDYDMIHLQLVSPKLSARPENVRVEICAEPVSLDTDNTRAWGFGFVGNCEFEDGKVVYQSGERFRSNSSVIALVRFDKGIFDSGSYQHRTFEDVFAEAEEGSDYEDDDEGMFAFLMGLFVTFVLGAVIIGRVSRRKRRLKILGCKDEDITWCRDVPYGGDIIESDFVLGRLGENVKGGSLASALILRMIYKGNLSVSKDVKGKVEIVFSEKATDGLDEASLGLYNMMLEASGSDKVLQDKEFSKWSGSHEKRVHDWIRLCDRQARARLAANHFGRPDTYTKAGQQQARNLVGFKKFLKDFTLIAERETPEVTLWQEYMVYGALYGIAEKVASQLKDINPKFLEQVNGYDNDTLGDVILRTRMLSNAITRSDASYAASQAARRSGMGGGTSFGGGGGFSGGGAGGGSR